MNLILVILVIPIAAFCLMTALHYTPDKSRYSNFVSLVMLTSVFVISLTALSQSASVVMGFDLGGFQAGDASTVQIGIWFKAAARQFTLLMIISLIALLRTIIELNDQKKETTIGQLTLAAYFFSFAGIVLAGNLLTTLFFYLILGLTALFSIRTRNSPAFNKLAVTFAFGMISLLSSMLIMWKSSGSFASDQITEAIGKGHLSGPLYQATEVLLLIGLFSTVSIFPFHTWIAATTGVGANQEEDLHSLFYMPGVIILSSAFSLLLDTTYVLAAIWIAVFSVIYSLILAYSSKEFDIRLNYITQAQIGLIFISVISGNPAAGLFIMTALAASRLLLKRSNLLVIHDSSENGWLNYWILAASSLLFAGVPLSAVYAGYTSILDKINTMGSPAAGLALTIVTLALVFTSSFVCLTHFLKIDYKKSQKINLPTKIRIYEYSGIFLLIIVLLSFVSSSNPFNHTTNWVMKFLGLQFSSLATGSFDNYLYIILVFAAYSVSAFAAFLSSGKRSVNEVPQAFWIERSIENVISYVVDPRRDERRNAITIPSLVKKLYPNSFGAYASILLFIIVLFYFILRNS